MPPLPCRSPLLYLQFYPIHTLCKNTFDTLFTYNVLKLYKKFLPTFLQNTFNYNRISEFIN